MADKGATPALDRLHRQHELEAAAVPGLGRELDPSTVRDRELARDRQAEAGATVIVRPEGPEDPLPLVRRDARAAVLHGDVHAAVLLAQREVDPAAVRRPPERVREQVR